MPNSFPVLTFVSALLRIVGWLFVFVGLFYFVMYHGILVPSRYDHSNYNEFLSRHESVNYQSISIGFGAIVTGLIAIIIGECVGVLFAIEANTRQTAAKLFAISTVPRSATPILAKPKASIQGDPDDQ